MKHLLAIFVISGIVSFASCSNRTAKDQQKSTVNLSQDSQQVQSSKTPPPPSGGGGNPTTIQHNKSFVLAEVIENRVKNDSEFSVVIKTIGVREDPSYPSIAVEGETYELYPNFVLGEDKEILDNQRNVKLMQLKNLKKGENFKAEIFLDENRHWMIQEVIEK